MLRIQKQLNSNRVEIIKDNKAEINELELKRVQQYIEATKELKKYIKGTVNPSGFYPSIYNSTGTYLGNQIEEFLIRTEKHVKQDKKKFGDYIEFETGLRVEVKTSKVSKRANGESSFTFSGIRTSKEGYAIDEYRIITLEEVFIKDKNMIIVNEYRLSPRQIINELFKNGYATKSDQDGYILQIQNSDKENSRLEFWREHYLVSTSSYETI